MTPRRLILAGMAAALAFMAPADAHHFPGMTPGENATEECETLRGAAFNDCYAATLSHPYLTATTEMELR